MPGPALWWGLRHRSGLPLPDVRGGVGHRTVAGERASMAHGEDRLHPGLSVFATQPIRVSLGCVGVAPSVMSLSQALVCQRSGMTVTRNHGGRGIDKYALRAWT